MHMVSPRYPLLLRKNSRVKDLNSSVKLSRKFVKNDRDKEDSVLQSYMQMRLYLQRFKGGHVKRQNGMNVADQNSEIFAAIQNIFQPIFISSQDIIHNLTSVSDIGMKKLLEDATRMKMSDVFGFRIVSRLSPVHEIEFRPRVLLTQACSAFPSNDFNDDDDSVVDTLVINLLSPYTGGGLEVTHADHTYYLDFSSSSSAVAIHRDCTYRFAPVTSGTRVTVICDAYVSKSVEKDERPCIWYGATRDDPKFHYKQSFSAQGKLDLTLALDKELISRNSIVLTLQHLYPEHQNKPTFLKGGDRALYDLLSEQYDVQVITATIHSCGANLFAAQYTPDIVQNSENTVKIHSDEVLNSLLVLTYKLTPQNVLEHAWVHQDEEQGVFSVSGLRIRKKL